MNSRILLTIATGAAALTLGTSSAASAAPHSGAQDHTTYGEALTSHVMKTYNFSAGEAQEYLDFKADEQSRLAALEEQGLGFDGAYFEGAQLHVIPENAAAQRAAKQQGLSVAEGKGQAELDRIADRVARLMDKDTGVQSVGSDIRSGTVAVAVTSEVKESTLEQLEQFPEVEITRGAPAGLNTTADVVPGRIMDLVPGSNCSLGYPGTQGGNNVLLTAGHCVEGLPDIYTASGAHIGKGVNSGFNSGARSNEMGLVDVDSEDTSWALVDTRGYDGYEAVNGLSKNPVGSDICKAGNTTGWTCGEIQGYNQTVNYGGGTRVSGLARATVCVEGGDSGGAYLSYNNLAQGMTSGGPVGAECGWNRAFSAGSYSFYQPAVDAANYYGVDILTQ